VGAVRTADSAEAIEAVLDRAPWLLSVRRSTGAGNGVIVGAMDGRVVGVMVGTEAVAAGVWVSWS